MTNFRIQPNDPCVIIEGLNWTDASRVCAWLEAAGHLNEVFKGGAWPIEHRDFLLELDFADAAIRLVSTFANRLAVVSMRWTLCSGFAVLAKLGFFGLKK